MRQDIVTLVRNRLYKEAITLYTTNHSSSLPPTIFTFPPLLKACSKLKLPSQGKTIHTHIIKSGFLLHIYVSTALTHMYMNFGFLNEASKVFDEMPHWTLASLNATISGFSENGCWKEAFLVFRHVQTGLFRPNSVTLASVLSACGSIVEHGLQVHCLAIKLGVEKDAYVGTSLVTMYSNCKEIGLAAEVFGEMGCKSVVSYNAFLSGLVQNNIPRAALRVFKEIAREKLNEKPNFVTLLSVISACTSLLDVKIGMQVHVFVLRREMMFDTEIGTALVDMYSKCGRWQLAYNVFKGLYGTRNLITWNCIIAGMMSNGQNELAVNLFEQLEYEGLKADYATWNSMINGFSQLSMGFEAVNFFLKMQLAGLLPSLKCITSLLTACSVMSALNTGKEIHGHVIRNVMNNDEFMVTALIDMYMKCGYSYVARRIFDQFARKPSDPAFWNAMICGYGRNGEFKSAIEIFDMMNENEIEPNTVTFTAVLSMCSHTGQINKGSQIFKMMRKCYFMNPKAEQFGCMIDMLGRSGKLNEARSLINEMPEPPASVYSSLLGSCVLHLNAEIGEEIAMKLSELEPDNPMPFVLLSNIYASLGNWKDSERTRQIIDNRGLSKLSGFSSVGCS
ncbi:hypothetical protein ACFE04_025155 [Oxalis oulophora]